MFRPFPLFVGLRYFRAKRRNQFISFISGMSLVSIAIGVMALITVLSVMNGFQDELRDRILSVTSDATISGFDNKLSDWPAVIREWGRKTGSCTIGRRARVGLPLWRRRNSQQRGGCALFPRRNSGMNRHNGHS